MNHTPIEQAILLAVEAHRGQTDLSGQPYILHPLRVMMGVSGEHEQIAGVLHDVVEDTSVTLADLRSMGFPEAAVNAVDCLTKRDGEAYEEYLSRVEGNPVARAVKLADLADNMRLDRLSEVTERDLKRMKKYEAAKARLLAAGL
ncbi:MAG TPA: GTP pyrophosphokinase [Kiritimatiellia bacterium]|nr:GTP pyrophosphokinase [Kiritimatiellia bacterium]